MLKTLPATYIKINMPGVFCVEKTFHRIGNGSSYAGLFLFQYQHIAGYDLPAETGVFYTAEQGELSAVFRQA